MTTTDNRPAGDRLERPLGGPSGSCPTCDTERVWASNKTSKHGAKALCRACDRAQHAKYRAENSERVKGATAKWRRDNPDKVKAYSDKYYAENTEKEKAYSAKYRAANPEKKRAYDAKWARENPEKCRAAAAKYRALIKGAILPGVPYDQYGKHEGLPCYICTAPAEATDHVHPLNRGGFHSNHNFKPICAPCNGSKRDRVWPGHDDWENFLESRRP
jgi:hypothetical protein